jgi:predicted dehydrogenase
VIGCGDIARHRYFPAIEALPELELKAVLARDEARCADVLARHGGRFHADLAAFLADPGVEAVIVATPHPSHSELALRALEAGKHVLVEKPMATSLDDASRLRAAAARSGRVLMALPYDGYPPLAEARRLIESGTIGTVGSADAVFAHGGPVHAPWFFDRAAAEWGVLADLGIYLISQLTYFFGRADSVSGHVRTLIPQRRSPQGEAFAVTVEDSAAAIIAWPQGITATLRTDWCSPADRRNIICETRIHGTEGIVFINLGQPDNALVVYAPGRRLAGAEPVVHNGLSDCYRVALPAFDFHRDILAGFAAAIAGGPTAELRAALDRQHHVIAIIAGIYQSSATGRVVRLEGVA